MLAINFVKINKFSKKNESLNKFYSKHALGSDIYIIPLRKIIWCALGATKSRIVKFESHKFLSYK